MKNNITGSPYPSRAHRKSHTTTIINPFQSIFKISSAACTTPVTNKIKQNLDRLQKGLHLPRYTHFNASKSHSLLCCNIATTATKSPGSAPQACLQMLQFVAVRYHCNKLFPRPSTPALTLPISALHKAPKGEDQPLHRSARGIDTTLSYTSPVAHCNIVTDTVGEPRF